MVNSTLCSLLLFSLAGCASLAPPVEPAPKTEVFVLGMIHGAHRTSATWGLDQVRATIHAIDPDVICCEIPPANWPAALALWQAEQRVEDSRVRVFPEYTDVLLPLTDELDFVVEPSAGWTPEMASARRERLTRFDESPEDAEGRTAYERDEAWATAWLEANPAPAADDDPFYIHSPRYDLRTKVELGAYELHLGPLIPDPGGWTAINEAHFALIADAIERHPGARVLVTFGAGHKYWFLERLRELPGVELVDVRAFLPGAVPLAEREQAVEELLLGFDSLRAVWSAERGQSGLPRQRVVAMLALEDSGKQLEALDASASNEASEFADGPQLGAVEATALESGTWFLRAPVRHLGDNASGAEWLEVTLERDVSRPGGFAWTQLELPAWLVSPASAGELH